MTFASQTQFHIERPWGPSRGLLRDYEPSDGTRMELYEALSGTPAENGTSDIVKFGKSR